MHFPRTIRLDESDAFAFPCAAEPGEWAVSGAFAFAERDPAGIGGKDRQAFANGFLGTDRSPQQADLSRRWPDAPNAGRVWRMDSSRSGNRFGL